MKRYRVTRTMKEVTDWNYVVRFLLLAEEGDYIEYDGRTVEKMDTGYLLISEDTSILTEDIIESCLFLRYDIVQTKPREQFNPLNR